MHPIAPRVEVSVGPEPPLDIVAAIPVGLNAGTHGGGNRLAAPEGPGTLLA